MPPAGDCGVIAGPGTVAAPAADRENAPQVWLLLGRLAGDNAQVRALGAALGWPTEEKRVRCGRRKRWFARAPEPRTIDGSLRLEPPWPDLVIGIGGQGSRIGAWIKRQSGGRTRHVQLGRIDGPYRRFDLIVSTPQYWLAAAGNLVSLTLPIVRRRPGELAAAAAALAPRLQQLPRPWTVLLVGGPSPPVRFELSDADALMARAEAVIAGRGGTLLVATGPRTPEAVVRRLAAAPPAAKALFPFARGEANFYPALLALADAFIVTSDSASMLADACWTGRPVEIFDLPAVLLPRHGWSRWNFLRRLRDRRRRRGLDGVEADRLDRFYDVGIRMGWFDPGRDVPALLRRLRERGVALAGGTTGGETGLAGLLAAELETVVGRIRRLMGAAGTSGR